MAISLANVSNSQEENEENEHKTLQPGAKTSSHPCLLQSRYFHSLHESIHRSQYCGNKTVMGSIVLLPSSV